MGTYLTIIKNAWQEGFSFRLNFLLWRVRVVLNVLFGYFLWHSVFQNTEHVFGYDKSQMLTYFILMTFIQGIVLSTQTFRIANEINQGSLSIFLIRPLNYLGYNLSRDIADKLINIFFSIIEIILLLILLQPPFYFQTNPYLLMLFFLSCVLAALLYFEINVILSCIGFWSNETWAPRFIFFILVIFLAGQYFPLDIVPPQIYTLLRLLPFGYLMYFPLNIYLGRVQSSELAFGFAITLVWIGIMYICMHAFWKKGLKVYTAYGQ